MEGVRLESMTAKEYRKARKRLGLSQQQLAKKIGRRQTCVSKRELGDKLIGLEAAMAMRFLLERQQGGGDA